jgi:acyl-coenzyme A synthetase/AMP-(fatty) acid ligase
MAAEAESRLGAQLLEIYGCSEAGTLAHRRPTRDETWQLFPGFGLTVRDAVASVCGGLLPQPVVLADRLELGDDGTFRLLGRQGDLVKVAGKRASLADLTARLLSIPGVEDGVIVEPSALGAGDGDRLCAFVVAPGLSAEAIRRHLTEMIDPAFLPRPLKVVAQLPRSQTGKLTRETLQALLDSDVGKR